MNRVKRNTKPNRRLSVRGSVLIWLISALCQLVFLCSGFAADNHYNLKPQKIADGVYVILGAKEHFTKENGGDIANIALFDAGDSVVVVGGGVSKIFGRALQKSIRQTFGKPIGRVIVTNFHPDHYLGVVNAFDPTLIWASAETIQGIQTLGGTMLDSMYVLLGDWMRDTANIAPGNTLQEGDMTFGNREFSVRLLSGYTPSDAVVYDKTSGVLVTGGLVFFNRAATFPNATISSWQQSLAELSTISYTVLVPGHGDVDRSDSAIKQTAAYIQWVDQTLTRAAAKAVDAVRLFRAYENSPFDRLAVIQEEFPRTVQQLYPAYERNLPGG